MSKEAYWFKHDVNAKDDPKCIILIEELGLEGYGIFWVLVETLRAQPDFKAPLRIIPAIARRHNTSTEKVKSVIGRYELFEIEDEEFFYSQSLINRMQPLLEKKKALVEAGKRGAEARWGKKNRVAIGVANGNKRREEEIREEKIRKDKSGIPSLSEVEDYFKERKEMIPKDIPLEAENFFAYYEEMNWKNSKGKKITEWKRQAATWMNNYKRYQEKRLDEHNGTKDKFDPEHARRFYEAQP